jgi:AraC-like DNA-binding protein
MSEIDTIIAETLTFRLHAGAVTRIAPKHTTGWRTLPDLVCSQVQLGDNRLFLKNAAPQVVPEGTLMLLPAGLPHRVDLIASEGCSRWIHGRFTVLGSLDVFNIFEAPLLIPPSSVATQVGDLIAQWAANRWENQLAQTAADQALGLHILSHLANCLKPRPQAVHRLEGYEAIRGVLEHLEAAPEESFSTKRLAAMSGLAPRSFHRAFLAATGSTPAKHQRILRIRMAQRFLISGNQSISWIATHCGWPDPFSFSRAFNRECGMSPRTYRQTTRDSNNVHSTAAKPEKPLS